jgi:hypothetical protein
LNPVFKTNRGQSQAGLAREGGSLGLFAINSCLLWRPKITLPTFMDLLNI